MYLVHFWFGFLLPSLFAADSHGPILAACLLLILLNVSREAVIPKSSLALAPLVLVLLVSGFSAGGGAVWSSIYVAIQALTWLAFAIVLAKKSSAVGFSKGLAWGILLFVVANLLATYSGQAGVRHAGFFPNANGLAAASASLFVASHLLQGQLPKEMGVVSRLLPVVGQAGLFLLLLLSGSRAGLLAACLYLASYGLFSVRRAVRNVAAIAVATPLIYVVGGDFLKNALIFQRLETAVVEFISGSSSADLEALEVAERVHLASIAVEGWKSSPLIGNGIGTFREKSGYAYAHNAYADLLFSVGTLGVIAYSFFVGSLVFWYMRRRRELRADNGFLPALIFLLFYNLFIPTHQILPFALVLGYLIYFPFRRSTVRQHD